MRVQHGIVIISLLLCCVSALWYALEHQYVLIMVHAEEPFKPDQAKTKVITMYWYQENDLHSDTQKLVWPEQEAERIKNITHAWLALMQEERMVRPTAHVETVALVPTRAEAIMSLSEPLFSASASIAQKAYLLEGLLTTLYQAEPSLTTVRFLVHNNLWHDDHFDMTISLPTTGFLDKKIPHAKTVLPPLRTVVVNPAGDSKRTGRIIGHEFERTLTLDAALDIAQALKRSSTGLVLTRTFGETIDSLHIIHVANQRPTDLFIDLRCYETTQRVPEISIYYYSARPETDFWQKKSHELALVPISKTYVKNIGVSRGYAAALSDHLTQALGDHVLVHAPQGLPLTPLIGITQPSIVIECGIKDKAHLGMISQELSNFIAFYQG